MTGEPGIVLKDLSFGYGRPDDLVLKGISVELPRGA